MKKVIYLFSVLIMGGIIFASCTNAGKQAKDAAARHACCCR